MPSADSPPGEPEQPAVMEAPPALRRKEAGGLGDLLLALDLARTTPLEALNLLARLQDEARAEQGPAPPLRLVGEERAGRYAPSVAGRSACCRRNSPSGCPTARPSDARW